MPFPYEQTGTKIVAKSYRDTNGTHFNMNKKSMTRRELV